MTSIVEGGTGRSIPVEIEGFFVIAWLDAWSELFEGTMGEKRIFFDAQLLPLGLHHIDGVVEESVGQGAGSGGHEYPCGGLVAHQDRKRSHVIEVGVRDDYGVDAVVRNIFVAGESPVTSLLGMHPGIEHHPRIPYFKQVAVGPNLIGPVEESKANISHRWRGI